MRICGVTGIQKMARGLVRTLGGCESVATSLLLTLVRPRRGGHRLHGINIKMSKRLDILTFLHIPFALNNQTLCFLPLAKCKFLLNGLLRQILLPFLCYILSYGSDSSSQLRMSCILFVLSVLPYQEIIFPVPIYMNGMYRINEYEE